MTYHACVWLDQRQAKIFDVTASDSQTLRVSDDRPVHHLHRKADHVGLGTVEMDPAMLKEVAGHLKEAKGILIMGPGKAKTVFKSYLDEQFPDVAGKVWDVQASDHPTDAEIVAAARTWFHSQDRMHQ